MDITDLFKVIQKAIDYIEVDCDYKILIDNGSIEFEIKFEDHCIKIPATSTLFDDVQHIVENYVISNNLVYRSGSCGGFLINTKCFIPLRFIKRLEKAIKSTRTLLTYFDNATANLFSDYIVVTINYHNVFLYDSGEISFLGETYDCVNQKLLKALSPRKTVKLWIEDGPEFSNIKNALNKMMWEIGVVPDIYKK